MEFIEYEKMATSLSRLEVTKEMKKAIWVVTEKIHGANFSFHVDEKSVKVARRRDFLEGNENFFNHLDANFMKTYPDKMKNVFLDIVDRYPDKDIVQVSIWGEIFGGYYVIDGNNLAAKKIKPVQTEVLYTPNIEWIAFDISYQTAEDEKAQEYLDYDIVMDIFKHRDIFHLKPLFKGPLNEVMNYNLKFDSTLPEILGCPALPEGSNIVEGVVAKSIKNMKCKDGYESEVRAVVKLKNPGFTERKPPVVKQKGEGKQKQAPKLFQMVMAYATEQRMTNAISKHGFPDNDEITKNVVDEFVEDILVDIKQDDDLYTQWANAVDSEHAKIKKSLTGKANGLIKKLKNAR